MQTSILYLINRSIHFKSLPSVMKIKNIIWFVPVIFSLGCYNLGKMLGGATIEGHRVLYHLMYDSRKADQKPKSFEAVVERAPGKGYVAIYRYYIFSRSLVRFSYTGRGRPELYDLVNKTGEINTPSAIPLTTLESVVIDQLLHRLDSLQVEGTAILRTGNAFNHAKDQSPRRP